MSLDSFTHEQFGHVGGLDSSELPKLGRLEHDLRYHLGLRIHRAARRLVNELALHHGPLHVVELLGLLRLGRHQVALLAAHLQQALVLRAGEAALRIHHTVVAGKQTEAVAALIG